MNYRKKLIEVGLPLEAINVASAREKSIRHGHPSTLHLWWARRPLAACRAVLFASLVDDPASDPMFGGDEDIEASKRAELFTLIEELVQWDNSNNPRVINKARAEIARCIASRKIETGQLKKTDKVANTATVHDIKQMLASAECVDKFLAAHAPPAVDPFCGGGSIPLEAQRLGLEAHGSDLNPVPVLITKALIELPVPFVAKPPVNPDSARTLSTATYVGAQGLAADVRYYGRWIWAEAQKRIGDLYPTITVPKSHGSGQATVIAWLWARTVKCPNPACGIDMPLVKSFCMSSKSGRRTWVEPLLDHTTRHLVFKIHQGEAVPGPKGTVDRKGARCFACKTTVPLEYIRAQGKAGCMGSQMMAVVAEWQRQRLYMPANAEQIQCASHAKPQWSPDVEMADNPFSLRPPLYGLKTFAQLFTPRQLVVLTTFSDLLGQLGDRISKDCKQLPSGKLPTNSSSGDHVCSYADVVVTYLACALSRSVDRSSTICTWDSSPKMEALRNTFSRQAMPMTWDFAEGNPFSSSSGSWMNNVEWVAKVVERLHPTCAGNVRQLDASASIGNVQAPIISTDPPYYDNIDYADLSDVFYVWLRRSLGAIYPTLFSTVLVPKMPELVATPYRFGGDRERAKKHFLDGLAKVFANIAAVQNAEYPITVYYAFKQEEDADDDELDARHDAVSTSTGWETMLEGLIKSGCGVTGTWPVRTELSNRPMASRMNSLASSIVIVCRRCPKNMPLATRREFLVALKKELPQALRELQHGNIAPVDLAQASIGPGMAVFTRYSKVMETGGSAMSVRTALGLINQSLDEVLAEQEGEFDVDTRWALAWFEQFGMDEGPFGVAETLSKAKNTAINGLIEAGIVKARAGKVQLLTRDELPDDWNPATDKRLTVWEVTQHLIRTIEKKGESVAAALLHQLGGIGEIARDLAYRLYTICERKKWADEALAYNGLVIAWSELSKLALSERSKTKAATQTKMFE
jgi:putative DNA methylase